eukprot:scaffold26856_cov65-Phaeocystis_antarctica.AAC.1
MSSPTRPDACTKVREITPVPSRSASEAHSTPRIIPRSRPPDTSTTFRAPSTRPRAAGAAAATAACSAAPAAPPAVVPATVRSTAPCTSASADSGGGGGDTVQAIADRPLCVNTGCCSPLAPHQVAAATGDARTSSKGRDRMAGAAGRPAPASDGRCADVCAVWVGDEFAKVKAELALLASSGRAILLGDLRLEDLEDTLEPACCGARREQVGRLHLARLVQRDAGGGEPHGHAVAAVARVGGWRVAQLLDDLVVPLRGGGRV